MRFTGLLLCVTLSACNSEIYVRDGVTDGDTFYLAERALTDDDPALQSWVSYSLSRSTCKLLIGGENPARQSSFDCELSARRLMLDTWADKKAVDATLADAYLDQLSLVREAGHLDEYVARHFRRSDWSVPEDVDIRAYRRWQRKYLPGHHPKTRIIGSWNYSRNVGPN
jgi:hypothetical protein